MGLDITGYKSLDDTHCTALVEVSYGSWHEFEDKLFRIVWGVRLNSIDLSEPGWELYPFHLLFVMMTDEVDFVFSDTKLLYKDFVKFRKKVKLLMDDQYYRYHYLAIAGLLRKSNYVKVY